MKGFHLIELLIVLAIVGILAAVSLPIYSSYVVKERRMEAATQLSKLAIAIEQYRTEHNTDDEITLDALHFPTFIANHQYQLNIQTSDHEDYLLMAKPLGAQAANDTACATLILSSTGEKNVTGTDSIGNCW